MKKLADRRRKFRELMDRREALIIPGAGNALTARVIADQQFDAVYVTGAGIANTHLGAPDIGLVTRCPPSPRSVTYRLSSILIPVLETPSTPNALCA